MQDFFVSISNNKNTELIAAFQNELGSQIETNNLAGYEI